MAVPRLADGAELDFFSGPRPQTFSVPILSLPSALSSRLVAVRRVLLLALLLALYLVLLQGPESLLGKTLFIAHLGLFLIWQPFVHAEQRLSPVWVAGLAVIVVFSAALLKAWILVLWIMMLGGIVGGKVLLFGARAPRLFYLMALGFLVATLFLMAVPMAVPMAKPPASILSLGYVGLPVLLLAMAALPRGSEPDSSREVVDFVYSLFMFLLLAVLMLGSLAAMLLLGSSYVEALLQALLSTGAMLLLLGLAWNPHSGFSGIGGLLSRYWMSIGLPVEKWLQELSDLALREEDPQVFVEQACNGIKQWLPWVSGGEWTAGTGGGHFGLTQGRHWEFSHGGMVLVLYTPHALSPTLIWHFNLLAQFVAQLHADKQRAVALKQLSYMQAVHETGARLTHDVKNLLQSLNALCSAGLEPGAESSPEYQSLLRRQLPAISGRLAQTLSKLNAPQGLSPLNWQPAAEWWQELRQRTTTMNWIDFTAGLPIAGRLPAEVFSGVVENLIRNAVEKRLREPALRMTVDLAAADAGCELTVCDNGSAMAEQIASGLLAGAVRSETGYGIGLYHAARHAQEAGYRLELTGNRPGQVCFRLAPAP